MKASSARRRSSGPSHVAQLAEHDDRAVVHRVVEGRAREDEPVDERGGQARPRAAGEGRGRARRPSRGRRRRRPRGRGASGSRRAGLGVGEPRCARAPRRGSRRSWRARSRPRCGARRTRVLGRRGGAHAGTLRAESGPAGRANRGKIDRTNGPPRRPGPGPGAGSLRDQLEEQRAPRRPPAGCRPGAALPPDPRAGPGARRLARGGGRGLRAARRRGVPRRPPRGGHGASAPGPPAGPGASGARAPAPRGRGRGAGL